METNYDFRKIFYNTEGPKCYSESSGLVLPDTSISDFDHGDFIEKLDEINDTWRIIEDPSTGRKFETAVVNQEKLGSETALVTSTSFSSLTQNAGNAVELAVHGAANPGMARVYVAFPGNGGSDSLDRDERKYLSQTGRFTRSRIGQNPTYDFAISALSAMTRALDAYSLSPNMITSDVEGGRFAIGAMSALEKNTIKGIYINGLTGISSGSSYTREMVGEDVRNRKSDDDSSVSEWGVNSELKKEAKKHIPNVYKGLEHTSLMTRTYADAIFNQLAYRKAFQGHDELDEPATHAVLRDIIPALVKQNALVTIQVNRYSKMHNRNHVIKFGRKVINLLAEIPDVSREDRLQILIGEGTLDHHTKHPEQRWVAERFALN